MFLPLFFGFLPLPATQAALSLRQERATSSSPADFDWTSIQASDSITWTPCFDAFECARFKVPLDYQTPDGPRAEIALQRLPATDKANYKGSILFNPGGPSVSGTQALLEVGPLLAQVVGPSYDVVGFDPRGTGATVPNAQCFDAREWDNFFQSEPAALFPADGSVALARARDEVIGMKCKVALGGTGSESLNGTVEEWGGGRFMDTASVATDMLRIAEAMGQEKLNYWGISYGTILGQYFAALFPDKVGLMLIDGVADGINWRNGDVLTSQRDADKIMDQFFALCSKAGRGVCPVSERSAKRTAGRVGRILKSVRDAPIPVPDHVNGPTVITEGLVYSFIRLQVYSPYAGFALMGEAFRALETRNASALADFAAVVPNERLPPWAQSNEALQAIACADMPDVSHESLASSQSLLRRTLRVSRWLAPTLVRVRTACIGWPIRGKTRYMGPLSASKLSGKMLVASNTLDPICPLADAKAVTKRYAGARLLVQNGLGHCVTLTMSSCAASAIGAFFQEGVLPSPGTVCQPDVLPLTSPIEPNGQY